MRALLFVTLLIFSCSVSATLSPSVYKMLERAQKAIQDGKSDQTLKSLLKLEKRTKRASMDKAMTWQLIGHIYVSLDNYPDAIAAYENSLSQKSLDDQIQHSIKRNLGQLYIAQNQFKEGREMLLEWLKAEKNNKNKAEVHILIANASTELDDIPDAITHVEKAIALRKKETSENWYQMLLGLYYQSEQFNQCIDVLNKMIVLFPQQLRYWQQLAGIYINLEQEDKALTTLQLAWKDGLIVEERDVMDLSNLYINQNLPLEAADVLLQGLQKEQVEAKFSYWQRVANFYMQARENERALEVLEQSTKYISEGDDLIPLIKIYVVAEKWQKALDTISMTRDYKVTQSDELAYFHGIALVETGGIEEARKKFLQVGKSGKYADDASQWLNYLEQGDF